MDDVRITCHCGKPLAIPVDETGSSPRSCSACGCNYAVIENNRRFRMKIGSLPECEEPTDHDRPQLQDSHWEDLVVAGVGAELEKDFPKAAQYFARACAMRPNEADPFIRLAGVQLRQSNTAEGLSRIQATLEKAEHLLDSGLSTHPLNKWDGRDEIERNRGECFLQQGKASEAIRHLQSALKINPEDKRAAMLLSQVQKAASPPTRLPKRVIWIIVLVAIGMILVVRFAVTRSHKSGMWTGRGATEFVAGRAGQAIREVEATDDQRAFARGRITSSSGADLFGSIAEARRIRDLQKPQSGGRIGQELPNLPKGETIDILNIAEGPYEGGSLKVRRMNGEVGYIVGGIGTVAVFEVFGDRGALAFLFMSAPYEFEGDIRAVKREIAKYENFVTTHQKSPWTSVALAKIADLHGYLLQCPMAVRERKREFAEIQSTYTRLAKTHRDAKWAAAAKRISQFLDQNEAEFCKSEVSSKLFSEWSVVHSDLTSKLPSLDLFE